MKYWAYVSNEILGPFEKEKLLELPSFSPSLLICPQTPVGEKTEDWKEASAYPELSALIGPAAEGALKYSAPPAPAAPAPASEPRPEPAQPAAALKPLTASSVEPVAPADHNIGGGNIQSNRLGKAQAEPSPSREASARTERLTAAGFEPASVSLPGGGADNTFGQGTPPAAGAAPGAFERTEPAFTPGAAPELENFSRPAFFAAPAEPAPAAAAPSSDALAAKLDSLAGNAVSKQDLSMALDPLRLKLDQMGEVISSIKNQQFQRDIMDKLAYLENSIGDIKAAMKTGAAAAVRPQAETTASIAPAQAKEPSGRTIFTPPQAKGAIVDTGTRRFDIGSIFRKLTRLILTLALLAAVVLGGIVSLKNLGVFDATTFIPFPLPFVKSAPPPQPAAEPQPAPQAPVPQPEEQARQPKAPDLSPEIIYFTRTYKAGPSGPSLEDKIAENSAAAGGDYANVNWQLKPGPEGVFEIAGVVPAKAGPLTFTYVVDYGKKTILPGDERGKAAFDALTARPPARARAAARARKAAAQPRQRAQARKPAAAPKQTESKEDEYEYVYEEDDGTGQ
ncbi:MAG TPA: hypothetical protein DCS63_00610 [Elusimicrobia bacterium]|nr:hypothetical protein [Elusimicrobiota bacterium]